MTSFGVTSCAKRELAAAEGIGGVDNGLGGLAVLFAEIGGALQPINQVFYDGLCDGSIDIALSLAPNVEEGCVNVTPIFDGAPAAVAIPMSLSDEGCISGTLGTVPLNVGEPPGTLANAVLRGTVDLATGFAFELGGTLDAQTASTFAEAIIEGGAGVVEEFFEINEDLSGDNYADCNALSATFDVRGAP